MLETIPNKGSLHGKFGWKNRARHRASRGIGAAIAARLAADGALVAVHYGRDDAGRQRHGREHRAPRRSGRFRYARSWASPVTWTHCSRASNAALRGARSTSWSTTPLSSATRQPSEDATLADFERVFAINVRAPLFIAQRALRVMPDGGRIINVSSGVTWFAIPEVVYAMTKGALNVMTRSLALTQGRRGITVNGVSPGITATDMNGWLTENAASAGQSRRHDRAR